MTENLDPLKVLVDDAKIAGWVGEGLDAYDEVPDF
jgi:hypothetical protein